MSSTVNPLSAITLSFSLKGRSRKPDLSTIDLSEMQPVYSWLMNVIAPEGEIPTSPFSVVLFLYELNSWLFKSKLLGILHFISVQSTITLVVGYFALKPSGIVASTSFREGQILITPKRGYIKFIHEVKIRPTVVSEMPNNNPKCFTGIACRSLIIVNRNSSFGLSSRGRLWRFVADKNMSKKN